jgi:hypothetical protein
LVQEERLRSKLVHRLTLFLILAIVLLLVMSSVQTPAIAQPGSCDPMGWFPTGYGLKDHTVFWYDDYYYLASIYYSTDAQKEKFFAYARSTDLCEWEDLTPILEGRVLGNWDEQAVWAPFVYEEAGVYYMYYTGLGRYMVQSIMLATSTNPADTLSWEPQGMIFQPNHPGMVWEVETWADCRDPMVLKVADTYYLYYTGLDEDGGIVGLAASTSPLGPWQDYGSMMTLPDDGTRSSGPLGSQMPESATVFPHAGQYYLFYNNGGEYYRVGASPGGPWSEAFEIYPGWAHEIWKGQEGRTYASYLVGYTDYTVIISQLIWDDFYFPHRPFIGESIYHSAIPLLSNNISTP